MTYPHHIPYEPYIPRVMKGDFTQEDIDKIIGFPWFHFYQHVCAVFGAEPFDGDNVVDFLFREFYSDLARALENAYLFGFDNGAASVIDYVVDDISPNDFIGEDKGIEEGPCQNTSTT